MPDVAAALDSIRAAAGSCQPGEWIRAVGGWHPSQFTEGRSPDYFTAAVQDIPAIAAALTVVGGAIVHSSGAIAEPASEARQLPEHG